MQYPEAFGFSSVYSLGFFPCAELRLLALRQFQAFLASNACAASASSYYFHAVRRLRGTMLFHGSHTSSSWGLPFWRLCLTVQSSRPAFGGRLTFVRHLQRRLQCCAILGKIMKRMTLLVAMAAVISGPANAQNSISDAACRNYENIMKNIILGYRAQGIPVGNAESAFKSEKDLNTRLFLKQLTREIYADPEAGRKFIQSGQFRADCVKIHRGY